MNAGAPLLRPWRDADVPALQQWRNDVALQAQLLARARGSDEGAVRRWLAERSAGPKSLLLVIADVTSDAPLGYLQIVDIDAEDRRGELGICLAPQAQGRGLGTAAVRLALEHARSEAGLRKINLRVRSDNARAIRCYERLGFVRCGVWREHVFIEGGWRDVVLMEIFL
ncbi:MAG TPA: GNAT family protein [Ramlibacter sp.]|jgi:RimJ/RimL family protein N-acetyltransferase|nr:GNAT family protein [Ramlibacter sp.]